MTFHQEGRDMCPCRHCDVGNPCPLASEIDRELEKARAAGRLEVAQAVGGVALEQALARSGGHPDRVEMLQLTLNALWRWTDDLY